MPNLPDTFDVYAPKLLDKRQVAANGLPYPDKAAALLALPLARRAQGLTVLIGTATVFKEHWWFGGTADADLIEKIPETSLEMASVATIEDMRNLPQVTSDTFSVLVQNHTRAGDSGGGVFDWNPDFVGRTSDASILSGSGAIDIFDNNGTFIKLHATVDGEPGRYIRREAGLNFAFMRSDWFGAFNTNNPSAVGPEYPESSTAIQAAYDALQINTFGIEPCPSGRYIRTGVLEIGYGYFKVTDTLWRSAWTTVQGKGLGATGLYAGQDAFPGSPADPSTEKWIIGWEKPGHVADNDCFDVVTKDLTAYCNYANGNGGVSGIHSPGAQGSYVRDVKVTHFSHRGVMARVTYGEVWIEGGQRGPGYTCIGTPSAIHGFVDVEHINQGGLYDYVYDPGGPNEDVTGLAMPAILLENLTAPYFQFLGGELSAQDIILYNVRGFHTDQFRTNPWDLGTKLNGRYTRCMDIRGDSYGNDLDFGPAYQDQKYHTYDIWDDSGIARAEGRVGEYTKKTGRYVSRQPSLVVGTFPTEQYFTEDTQFGIRWRNTYSNNFSALEPGEVTINFVNTGVTSSLLATRTGNVITITTERVEVSPGVGECVSTVFDIIEELWAKRLDFSKSKENAAIWATLPVGVATSLPVVTATAWSTIFNPPNGASIVLPPSAHPNFDWRGMGEGQTIYWPDIDGSGGKAVVTKEAPLKLEYQTSTTSPVPNTVVRRDASGAVPGVNTSPLVTGTAVAANGSTSIPVTVQPKSASGGFVISCALDDVPTSVLTINIHLTAAQFGGGVDWGFASYSALARLTVSTGIDTSFNGLIQEFRIVGNVSEAHVEEVTQQRYAPVGITGNSLVPVTVSVSPGPGNEINFIVKVTGAPAIYPLSSLNLEIL